MTPDLQFQIFSRELNTDLIDQLLSQNVGTSTNTLLPIDDMLSGLIYVSIKAQMADTPLLLQLIKNFTLNHRQE
jgi:hypothetical protein